MSTRLAGLIIFVCGILCVAALFAKPATEVPKSHGLEVGPFCTTYPYGLTMLIDRGAAFVIYPEADMPNSRFGQHDEAMAPYPTRAPDGSYSGKAGMRRVSRASTPAWSRK
jgi:hypothetical protein